MEIVDAYWDPIAVKKTAPKDINNRKMKILRSKVFSCINPLFLYSRNSAASIANSIKGGPIKIVVERYNHKPIIEFSWRLTLENVLCLYV